MLRLHSNASISNGTLRIAHFNANSLLGHIDQARAHIDSLSLHVIAVTESWLSPNVADVLISLNGFSILRNDRSGRRGGGVLCYIHNSFKVKMLASSASQTFGAPEFMIIELGVSAKDRVLFAVIYRRPKGLLLNEFFKELSRFSFAYSNIVICGDLNCNLLTNNFQPNHLRDLATSNALSIVHSGPTYHTMVTDSWLDVFIVDALDKIVSYSKSTSPFIAGHDFCQISYRVSARPPIKRHMLKRDLRSFEVARFLALLTPLLTNLLSDLTSVISISELNTLANSVSDSCLTAFDSCAPLKRFSISRPHAPWLTAELKLRIKQKNRLYCNAKRSGSTLNIAIYREFRSRLADDLRRTRGDYLLRHLTPITDVRLLWRRLNQMGLTKTPANSPLVFFSNDELNLHYSSVSTALPRNSISPIASSPPIPSSDHPSFSFLPIVGDDITEAIRMTPPSSMTAGPDSISPFILHNSLPLLSTVLMHLLNHSFRLSAFPLTWKKALLRPLLKSNRPLSPSDTRPIASLSEFSKLFERIVHKQITSYLTQHNLLDPCQSGFRKYYSTQTLLLKLCHDIRAAVDQRKLTILVLFDFSKAFDTISHHLLLLKLRKFGFSEPVLKWFESYLSDRTQAVKGIDGTISNWLGTSAGVPQGSVLGPLLFSLFINDIGSNLRHSQHLIFADDTQIYLSCLPSQLAVGLANIQHDAGVIAKFASDNGLELNSRKSKVLILGSGSYLNSINLDNLPPININGTAVPFVREARNLGVIFTSNLSWSPHVSSICHKVNLTLHKLKFHRNSLSTSLKTHLIMSLIFPYLDYCCLVYNDMTDYLNTKLQRAVNSCIRYIFNLRRDVHISPYRRRLKWLSIKSRRLFFLGTLTFRIINNQAPPYLNDLFVRHVHGDSASRRLPPETFHIPNHRTSTFRNSFVLSAAYFWHSIPADLKSASTLSSFKPLLFNYLFTNENIEADESGATYSDSDR